MSHVIISQNLMSHVTTRPENAYVALSILRV